MIDMTLERFAGLVRTAGVHRVYLTQYPSVDGGGWYLDVDHADNAVSRQLYTQRGSVRVFKSADAALRVLADAGYRGSIHVVLDPCP